MNYYFYNTDSRSIFLSPQPRYQILIERQFATIGGDPQHFGEQFRQLKPDDVLLMYENRVGVVAIGSVQENWDGKHYTEPWYYHPEEMINLTGGAFEYRIKVDWYLNISDRPITLERIRQLFRSKGFTPRGTIKKNIKYRLEIEQMIAESLTSNFSNTLAFDLEAPLPGRIKMTTYRILRDTNMARYVKYLHKYQCQICGHTIQLQDGKYYAEAHHIKPLGEPHNGPDIIGNIICVCPNHHAELDYGTSTIELSTLNCSQRHAIESQYVDYHNRFIHI